LPNITFVFQSELAPMFSIKAHVKITAAVFSAFTISSCNRHFAVQKNEYRQYAMDSQLSVDSSVVKYYLPYKNKMEAEMNRVIGQADHEITKTSKPESLLGNFFSDALLAEGLKKEPSVQFTFSTKGGLRTGIPKGDITVSDIFELMPFENEIVLLKISGATVQKLIDFIVNDKGQPVAGMTMKIKNNKAYDVTIAGKPFDMNQTYNLLTYDYLANGGGDVTFLDKPIARNNIGLKVRDALMQYIAEQTKSGKKINTQLDGRIVVEND